MIKSAPSSETADNSEQVANAVPPSAETELTVVKDRLMRALADQENVRRQARRDRDDAVRYAIANFASDLLATADNLEHAITSIPPESRSDPSVASLFAGVEATRRVLLDAFARHGLARFAPIGEPFDPNLHEASFEVADGNYPPGSVVSVVRPGYRLHDRLLRPALVGVGRRPPAADEGHGAALEGRG